MRRARVGFERPAGCREALGLVTGYLEGALSAERRRRFEDHLAGCAECPVHLEQVRVTVEVLHWFGAGDIPQDVLRRLCEAFARSGGSAVSSSGAPSVPHPGARRVSGPGALPVTGPGAPPVPGSGASPLLDPGGPPVAEGGQ
ncbi:zf-HC2 domain-containing protein [Streptosporangium sp. NPDC051023]|uniref:zf-HC2 domain-containing protein n=1 Tax=Streptosporangium sp. NPDC051023 TaxID=3155410 RepID=UPI00344F1917